MLQGKVKRSKRNKGGWKWRKKKVKTLYKVFREELSDKVILKRKPEESEEKSPVKI